MTDEPKPKRRGRPKKEENVRMRPLNVEVPEDLQLHRRGTLCKLDTGMSLKEQVAAAYDEWLTRKGYSKPTDET
ncbi:hypothetical protein [Streptomyces tendae]|uniref:CopG family transcriptional regulator n=1 Tax=Streptomyces tendae TaxID=1932 RepID=A0ABX6A2L5_STRTE|nr:hypothetical protein [Streptomyces tendae]QER90597.1 hypothetical protein F3L20_33800 [Streptomyces tendae]